MGISLTANSVKKNDDEIATEKYVDARTAGYFATVHPDYPEEEEYNIIISSGMNGSLSMSGDTVEIRASHEFNIIGDTKIDGSLKVGENSVVTENQLSTIATSGSIYDVAEASKTEDDVVYLLLDCNW
jgi:hypothetical protein